MRLYHGTTSKHLPSILRHGIRPRGSAAGNWPTAGASRSDAVYLTDCYPLQYAMQALYAEAAERERREWQGHRHYRERAWLAQANESKRRRLAREMEARAKAAERERGNSLAAVIEIDADKFNPFALIPDEDAIEQALLCNGAMQHLGPAALLAHARERAQQMAGYHMASLRTLGTCAHLGTIPATAITRVAVVDPMKAPELAYYVRINPVTVLNFRDVGAQLRGLVAWVFGEPPPYFEGPAESDRAGITIMAAPVTPRALESPERQSANRLYN